MEHLPLFKNNKERLYLFVFLALLFSFNLFLQFSNFKTFTKDEIYQSDVKILNIYKKENYDVLKLQSDDFTFFTSTNNTNLQILQDINIYIITKDISFFEYLKGFYAKSFNINQLEVKENIKTDIYNYIKAQHDNTSIASLYSALFLAIPVDKTIREICSYFGISHLIAISGFHLGVMSLVLYFIFNLIYSPIHQNYFPYRNKRFDILIVVSIILFSYLLLVDLVPSLLRAFVMFIFGLFLVRNHIKILSFETLFIVVLIIIALFPKLLFSLSLWFSVAGVFYIYLFLHYFKSLNKYLQFVLFNLWIYLAMNPIVHYFFGVTSLEQLYSPIVTVLFTVFYPLVALLHIFNIGYLLDGMLLSLLNYELSSYEIVTPFWFFIGFIVISLMSIISKRAFIVLNVALLGFSIYLFV